MVMAGLSLQEVCISLCKVPTSKGNTTVYACVHLGQKEKDEPLRERSLFRPLSITHTTINMAMKPTSAAVLSRQFMSLIAL